jgi:hypothetical protein
VQATWIVLWSLGTQDKGILGKYPLLRVPTDRSIKKSKAKKCIIELMLLHICGDININLTLTTNVNLATPSKGMQLVLNQPRATRAGQFADLM